MSFDLAIMLPMMLALYFSRHNARLFFMGALILVSHIFDLIYVVGVGTGNALNLGFWYESLIENGSMSPMLSWELSFFVILLVASKDYILQVIFGLRGGFSEIILSVTFAASCIFHLVVLMELAHESREFLNWYYFRSNFIKIILLLQLSVIYGSLTIGGIQNGGNNWANSIRDFVGNIINRIFRFESIEVKR